MALEPSLWNVSNMNPKVWEASGHVQNFTDPLVDCTGKCKKRWREDHLAEERRVRGKDPETAGCPECGGALTDARMVGGADYGSETPPPENSRYRDLPTRRRRTAR